MDLWAILRGVKLSTGHFQWEMAENYHQPWCRDGLGVEWGYNQMYSLTYLFTYLGVSKEESESRGWAYLAPANCH